MSDAIGSGERLLAMSERELVDRTLKPVIDGLSDAELQELAKRIRSVRDRARRIASQQKREMRGKAEPRGAMAAADNTGSLGKSDVLTEAARRVSAALRQRKAPVQPRPTQGEIGQKLMAKNLAAQATSRPAPGRTASSGMPAKVNPKSTVKMDPRRSGGCPRRPRPHRRSATSADGGRPRARSLQPAFKLVDKSDGGLRRI